MSELVQKIHCLRCKSAFSKDGIAKERVGSALGSPWPQVVDAIKNLYVVQSPQTISFWMSCMLANNIVNDGSGDVKTNTIQGYNTPVTHSVFVNNIDYSLTQIKNVFEYLFNGLTPYTFTLNFSHRNASGDETGIHVPSRVSDPSYSLTSGPGLTDLVGDLRFSMITIDGSYNTLAYAYSAGGIPQQQGNVGGDCRLDVSEYWRAEGTTTGTINIPQVVTHESLHIFSLGHNTNTSSIMYPVIQNPTQNFASRYPNGLKGSPEDTFTINAIYGGTGAFVGVNLNGDIYIRTGLTAFATDGNLWSLVSTTPKFDRTSLGPDGSLWGTSSGNVYRRVGVKTATPTGTSWTLVSSTPKMVEISVGVYGQTYCVDGPGNIYYRSNVVPGTIGNSWIQISGQLNKLAVAPKGNLYGINLVGYVYLRSGITPTVPQGTTWSLLSTTPVMKEIGVGYNNQLWCIGNDNKLYYRQNISLEVPLGSSWQQVPFSHGTPSKISVTPYGGILLITTDNNIWNLLGVSGATPTGNGLWDQIEGSLTPSISGGYLR
jgi:hypothetical protein